MSVIKSTGTLFLLMAALLGISNSVSATVLGYTDILIGSEPGSVSIVENRYGANGIRRINDYAHDSSIRNTDVEWNFLGGAEAPSFTQIAKHAGYYSEFGIIHEDKFWSFKPFREEFGTDSGIKFYLGIMVTASNGNQFLWSSNSEDNSDGLDHMVTWVIDEAAGIYAVAFEDLPNGGDQDFNDLILEVRGFVDGPIPVPEPTALVLISLGLAGIGYRRHRSKKTE